MFVRFYAPWCHMRCMFHISHLIYRKKVSSVLNSRNLSYAPSRNYPLFPGPGCVAGLEFHGPRISQRLQPVPGKSCSPRRRLYEPEASPDFRFSGIPVSAFRTSEIGNRNSEARAMAGKWNNASLALLEKFLLTEKLINEKLTFRNNIPLFHVRGKDSSPKKFLYFQ